MLKSILVFGLTRRPIVVLAVMVFLGAGIFAFTRLNIEAYPNPAPVILEITAQAPGLSAEEMEKYYTIPMEIALYPAPGVVNIRSTSFYGLSFVRVTFRYGIDFDAAYANAAVYMQQGVNLPGTQVPQIQQSSLVGEIIRYQVTGPAHFGLTNLRTVQDWIVTRRLLAIPGDAGTERHAAAHAAKELTPIKLEVAERWTGSLTESEKRRVLPKPRTVARAR